MIGGQMLRLASMSGYNLQPKDDQRGKGSDHQSRDEEVLGRDLTGAVGDRHQKIIDQFDLAACQPDMIKLSTKNRIRHPHSLICFFDNI